MVEIAKPMVFQGFALVPLPVVSEPVGETYFGLVDAKFAATAQIPVIGTVVYVFPTSDPPHVPPTTATYPEAGVTVNALVAPLFTVCGVDGLIVPFGPALGVTV
jgi:hypothetical protein